MRTDYIAPTRRALALILFGTAIALAPVLAGKAYPAAPGRGEPTAAARAQSPVDGTRAARDEAEAKCQTQRRRLWVAGEGWVIRRVSACL